METIVNKDIRWGFIGVQVNKSWVLSSIGDWDEVNTDKELSEEDEFKVDTLIRVFACNLESYLNKGNYDEINYLVGDLFSMVSSYYPMNSLSDSEVETPVFVKEFEKTLFEEYPICLEKKNRRFHKMEDFENKVISVFKNLVEEEKNKK